MSFSELADSPAFRRLLLAAIAVLGAMAAISAGFNPKGSIDVYALVADGHSMWDGGFHFLHDNPHSMVAAPIVCQEWVHSAVMAPLADAFGWQGIGMWASFQSLALFAAMSWMVAGFDCLSHMGTENRWTVSLLCSLAVIFVSSPVLSARPIWLSAALLCCETRLARDYMRDGGRWRFGLLLLAIVLESNSHASFIWLDYALIALSSLTVPAPSRRMLSLLVCVPAALVNPYGAYALAYLPVSTSLLHGMYIDELLPLVDPESGISAKGRIAGISACAFLSVVIAYAVVHRKRDREQLAWQLIGVIAIVATLTAARNVWLALVLVAPVGLVMFAAEENGRMLGKCARDDRLRWAGVGLALALSLNFGMSAQGNFAADDPFPIVPAENERNFLDDPGASVIVDQWLGGMVELYGLDVAIDTRPEIWAAAYLPGSETSFLEDYIAMADVKTATADSMHDYIAKYRFKWVPVKRGSVAAEAMDEYGTLMGYEMLVGTEEAPIWKLMEDEPGDG